MLINIGINRNNSCIWICTNNRIGGDVNRLIETIVVFEFKHINNTPINPPRLIETIVVFESGWYYSLQRLSRD